MSNATDAVTSIHGHEIIHLVHNAAPPFTRHSLAAEVARRFGSDVRFQTCSAARMTLDQLLEFLLVRGKVVEFDGRLCTDMSKVCDHGDDHHHD